MLFRWLPLPLGTGHCYGHLFYTIICQHIPGSTSCSDDLAMYLCHVISWHSYLDNILVIWDGERTIGPIP